MSSLGSILNSAQTLSNLKAYQKKNEALYSKRKDSASSPIEKKSVKIQDAHEAYRRMMKRK